MRDYVSTLRARNPEDIIADKYYKLIKDKID
jgi:hypothetical protein